MAKNGNIFIVLAYNGSSYVPLACCKSNEIESRCGTIEVASPTQGSFREFIADRKEWTFTTSYLVSTNNTDYYARLADILQVGNTVPIVWRNRQTSEELRGNAIITTCKMTATRGSLAVGSFSFQGTGALSYVNP